MKTCQKCGQAYDTEQCPYCERWLHRVISYQMFRQGNLGFAFLGFLLPFVGLILYFFLRRITPDNAALIGLGALISSIFAIVLALAFMILLLW